MILTVIVPVYNAAEYLNKCIKSIAEQDISSSLYEIIAVNDGSTDNSLIILQNIQKKYSNLKIITQENRGLSGARNTGLDNALGTYILFVDADDYILPNVTKNLIELADKNKTDILEFAALGITPENKIVYTAKASTKNNVVSGENYLSSINYMGSACNKLYSLSFLNKHSLRFMPHVFIEDIEFNTRAVFFSKRILAIDKIIAHFLQREGSITRTKNFVKKEKMIYDIFTVLKSINDFTENEVTQKSKAFKPLKERVSSLIATMLIRVLKDTKSTKIKIEIINNLRKENLYPNKYNPNTRDKRWFLVFTNQYILFSICCTLFSSYNRLKYGK